MAYPDRCVHKVGILEKRSSSISEKRSCQYFKAAVSISKQSVFMKTDAISVSEKGSSQYFKEREQSVFQKRGAVGQVYKKVRVYLYGRGVPYSAQRFL